MRGPVDAAGNALHNAHALISLLPGALGGAGRIPGRSRDTPGLLGHGAHGPGGTSGGRVLLLGHPAGGVDLLGNPGGRAGQPAGNHARGLGNLRNAFVLHADDLTLPHGLGDVGHQGEGTQQLAVHIQQACGVDQHMARPAAHREGIRLVLNVGIVQKHLFGIGHSVGIIEKGLAAQPSLVVLGPPLEVVDVHSPLIHEGDAVIGIRNHAGQAHAPKEPLGKAQFGFEVGDHGGQAVSQAAQLKTVGHGEGRVEIASGHLAGSRGQFRHGPDHGAAQKKQQRGDEQAHARQGQSNITEGARFQVVDGRSDILGHHQGTQNGFGRAVAVMTILAVGNAGNHQEATEAVRFHQTADLEGCAQGVGGQLPRFRRPQAFPQRRAHGRGIRGIGDLAVEARQIDGHVLVIIRQKAHDLASFRVIAPLHGGFHKPCQQLGVQTGGGFQTAQSGVAVLDTVEDDQAAEDDHGRDHDQQSAFADQRHIPGGEKHAVLLMCSAMDQRLEVEGFDAAFIVTGEAILVTRRAPDGGGVTTFGMRRSRTVAGFTAHIRKMRRGLIVHKAALAVACAVAGVAAPQLFRRQLGSHGADVFPGAGLLGIFPERLILLSMALGAFPGTHIRTGGGVDGSRAGRNRRQHADGDSETQ